MSFAGKTGGLPVHAVNSCLAGGLRAKEECAVWIGCEPLSGLRGEPVSWKAGRVAKECSGGGVVHIGKRSGLDEA